MAPLADIPRISRLCCLAAMVLLWAAGPALCFGHGAPVHRIPPSGASIDRCGLCLASTACAVPDCPADHHCCGMHGPSLLAGIPAPRTKPADDRAVGLAPHDGPGYAATARPSARRSRGPPRGGPPPHLLSLRTVVLLT